jgi:hypothetical protein
MWHGLDLRDDQVVAGRGGGENLPVRAADAQ